MEEIQILDIRFTEWFGGAYDGIEITSRSNHADKYVLELLQSELIKQNVSIKEIHYQGALASNTIRGFRFFTKKKLSEEQISNLKEHFKPIL